MRLCVSKIRLDHPAIKIVQSHFQERLYVDVLTT